MQKLIQHSYRWAKTEPLLLLISLTVVAGTWGFIELADEVIEGDTQAFDRWAVQAMRDPSDLSKPIGPAWLAEAGRDVTGLGGVAVLVLITTAVAGFLTIARGYRTLLLLVVTTSSGIVASLALKHLFDRPRPDFVPHLSNVYTSSFPSGHSMMSAVVYMTLAAIIAATTRRRSLKIYVFVIAFILTGVVGVSRIYMGVHYPTDVMAGWTAGIVWALAIWRITDALLRRQKIEKPRNQQSSIENVPQSK